MEDALSFSVTCKTVECSKLETYKHKSKKENVKENEMTKKKHTKKKKHEKTTTTKKKNNENSIKKTITCDSNTQPFQM